MILPGTHTQTLLPGMYVRFPVEEARDDHSYRDFRIGQLQSIDQETGQATVRWRAYTPGETPQIVIRDIPSEDLIRCQILPSSSFIHQSTGQRGQLLCSCEGQLGNVLRNYYVVLEGETCLLPEAEIDVAAHCQDPDPLEQLRHFEFQHPVWKRSRDQMVRLHSELHSLTYGIEDLVGSRVRLLAHQAEVIVRILSDPLCRYILADEVGLGKTVEAAVILKGLRRRHSDLKTLIVVPRALLQQWYNELNGKFWLDFPRFHPTKLFLAALHDLASAIPAPGILVSTEDLVEYPELATWLLQQKWGLLIADEAHHLSKSTYLYDHLLQLSRQAERALILSATPIQRHATEYFSLLCLMDPARYVGREATFQEMLSAQSRITDVVAYLTPDLTPTRFDPEEFEEEMEVLQELQAQDAILASLIEQVRGQARGRDRGLEAAHEAISYLSTNYRIESRMIRNRRAALALSLPERTLEADYQYVPGSAEREMLEALYDYIDRACQIHYNHPLVREYGRTLLHAASSSPPALLTLLRHRALILSGSAPHRESFAGNLTRPASPREEQTRLARLVEQVPVWEDESLLLPSLLRLSEGWEEETTRYLTKLSSPEVPPAAPHRLAQALRVLYTSSRIPQESQKILLFSAWPQTLAFLYPYIVKWHGQEAVVRFDVSCSAADLESAATAFQGSARCHFLLFDELGGEGRNFQMADQIIHLDLPWTPAQLEQRIGRVDRLGRTGEVCSVVPLAKETVENDLFQIWQEAFHLFTQSMSGLEIALETIQDELLEASSRGVREGVRGLIAPMVQRAEELRTTVEKERYFDEGGINHRWHRHFEEVSEQFRNGDRVRAACLSWAGVAGLDFFYDRESDILEFSPTRFNQASMKNAKFFEPPNMEEALRRAGNPANLVIRGTYNRDLAVRREDLVFFAPGDDPWTDALITNALEADRGRCTAILRPAPELSKSWQGLELLYTIQVDPRPLYAAGYGPIHLHRAQGFLHVPFHRLLLSTSGKIERMNSPLWAVVDRPFSKARDRHLGKREDGSWAEFRIAFPPTQWHALLAHLIQRAEEELQEQFSFMAELAEEAGEGFARQAAGQRAARRWIAGEVLGGIEKDEIADALVKGIAHPLWRLESACFWLLEGAAQ